MFKFRYYYLYWIFFFLFLAGWYVSFGFLSEEIYFYTILTIICYISTALIVSALRDYAKQKIHLWIIFFILFVGYFAKFYILCFLRSHGSGGYFGNFNQLERELLGASWVFLEYYEAITIVYCAFALVAFGLSMRINHLLKGSVTHNLIVSRFNVTKSALKAILGLSILLAVVVTYLQLMLGIWYGSVALQDNPLPYRLSGIISVISNVIIPLLFILTVWLADKTRSAKLLKVGIGSYFIYGVTVGVLSTSKGSLLAVLISLFLLWLVTETLTRQRKSLLVLLLIFIGPFNGFLVLNRILRNLEPESGVIEIALLSFRIFFSHDSEHLSFVELDPIWANYLGLLMRVNGADSLINIIAFDPDFSWSRILNLVFHSPYTVSTLYAEDVLGIFNDVGTAFSPSLFGYFYFVFGSVGGVCFGVAAYTLIWHYLLKALQALKLRGEPIVMSIALIVLARYTSEGTLESLPQAIALTMLAAGGGEYLLRLIAIRTQIITSPIRVA